MRWPAPGDSLIASEWRPVTTKGQDMIRGLEFLLHLKEGKKAGD